MVAVLSDTDDMYPDMQRMAWACSRAWRSASTLSFSLARHLDTLRVRRSTFALLRRRCRASDSAVVSKRDLAEEHLLRVDGMEHAR